MAAEIDQEALKRACEAMANYHNTDLVEDMPRTTPEMFASYQIVPYEDWLLFVPPGGFTNQQFLVSNGTVAEFPGWMPFEEALQKAQAMRAEGRSGFDPGEREIGG